MRTNEGYVKDESLFELVFVRTPGPVEVEGLEVGMSAPGEIETLLPWELVRDGNGNGMIDSGDVLRTVALIDELLVLARENASLVITVLQPFEKGHKQVWSGTWQPPRQ